MYYPHYIYPNYHVNVPMPYIRQQPIYWGYPQATNMGNLHQPMQIEERSENMGLKIKGNSLL